MFVACRIPEADFAVLRADENYGELGVELDEAFIDQCGVRQLQRVCIGGIVEAPLALAIIAVAPRLQYAGRADTVERAGEVVAAIDGPPGRRGAAKLLHEAFFIGPVLRGLQCLPRGVKLAGRERIHRCQRDVLELPGDDIALRGKTGQGLFVVPIGG